MPATIVLDDDESPGSEEEEELGGRNDDQSDKFRDDAPSGGRPNGGSLLHNVVVDGQRESESKNKQRLSEEDADALVEVLQEGVTDTYRTWRDRLRLIALWQGVSLLLTGTAVFSQLLADASINLPTTQSFVNYFVLMASFGVLMYRRGERPREALWKYFIIALADVEGNFLLVLAYQYTTITSVQLLDCFTIPIVMILSWRLFNARYRKVHLVGAGVAILGLGLLVTSDAVLGKSSAGQQEEAPNPILGDILVMIGACLYGVSNIGQEYMVKERDRVEFLFFLGLFGSAIGGVQMGIFEHEAIRDLFLQADARILGYLLGFNGCLFGMYVAVPILLEVSSATFMNLSLLTADFYSLAVAMVLFGSKPSLLYFAAFVVIVSGLITYNIAGDPTSSLHRRPSLRSSSEEAMSERILDGADRNEQQG